VTTEPPPVPKYKLTVTVYGNSHGEVEHELLMLTRGGYRLDSDHGQRDAFSVHGGRSSRVLEHTNPDQTPEAYKAALRAWGTRDRSKG
jgi:hypothetical protein